MFGLSFLSFIYANVARFKRFKGLGFEAELWEDTKQEATDLIARLRDVVSIYTREVLLGRVKSGRWSSKINWRDHWKLYDDLVIQHTKLGQNIDFSSVKKIIDDYFLFDMTMPEIEKLRLATNTARNSAVKAIEQEFGSPITDTTGYSERHRQLQAVKADKFLRN